MQTASLSQVEIVNPLIKLVKAREEIYFQLLAFVNSHLASSSNDLDNTSVFSQFISLLDCRHQQLVSNEQAFLDSLEDPFIEEGEPDEDPVSKQMLRLFLRLLQILEASIERVRRSLFEDNGRAVREYNRFRASFNKIIKQDCFVAKDFVDLILGYCASKYKRQFQKLSRYIEKVKEGDNICFKEMFCRDSSQLEASPSPDDRRTKDEPKKTRRLFKKIDMDKHLSSTEEPEKKAVTVKKTTTKPVKRKLAKNRSRDYEEDDEEPSKKKTANRLYQFYLPMELSKKDFLEDYVYEKINEEKHKKDLMHKLLERNKTINTQINSHVRKSMHYLPLPIPITLPQKSSGDERNESAISKASLRTSFVISKKKSSHYFETSNEKAGEKKAGERKELGTSTKNINPRRRSSHSTSRTHERSKKLVVVRAPVLFVEEIIPQAAISQTQWLQAPLTMKCKDKKTDNIRLKRKNNVIPLENALLQENFRYPL